MSGGQRTRLAPSPTGALHLGNARTFLVNWLLARQRGWRVVLRIDDLDGPRIKPETSQQAIDILEWLGLDWDEGPYFQTQSIAEYRAALEQLAATGCIYPCRCTRSQIAASLASAPHAGDHELRYPGTCRPVEPEPIAAATLDDPDVSWRIRVPGGEFAFDDQFAGRFGEPTRDVVGDFRIAGAGGSASYQLAVVIDDARQSIDRVVRGDDLLSSTPRQMLVRRKLGLEPDPAYFHLPLVIGPDGRRLAKRHGDSRLVTYRSLGVPAERLIGLLAEWSGCGERRPVTAAELVEQFDLGQLPHKAVVMTARDDAWLRGKVS